MTGRVLLLAALLSLFGATLRAADPQIKVASEQEEVIVGQPYLLRVEVLVPTFMPSPPAFPSFELPGLITRLPERSTSPVSKQIEGETWSGVRRTYRIYPMRAGVVEIPAQDISLEYRDPESIDTLSITAQIPPSQIRAVVPEGARDLDPLIIAQEVAIAQSWEGTEEDSLDVGDAVVRRLEVTVTGASALFVPPLLGDAPPPSDAAAQGEAEAAFAPYPDDAQVDESFDRGIMSGTRVERVSYIAQSGGTVRFPDIVLGWYNLETKKTEEITLEGRAFTVRQPPAEAAPRAPRDLVGGIAWAALALLAVWALYRWGWPVVRPALLRIKARYASSVFASQRAAKRAAAARDLSGLFSALDERAVRGAPPGRDLGKAIDSLKRAMFRAGADTAEAEWRAVQKALGRDRPTWRQRRDRPEDLPQLNPFAKT